MRKKIVKDLNEGFDWYCKQVDSYLPEMPGDNFNFIVKFYSKKYWDSLAMLPSSSSGRYHHKMENLRPFGLINHMLRTVWTVKELCIEELGYDGANGKWKSHPKARRAITAAFLHDFGKMTTFKVHHGKEAAKYLACGDNDKARIPTDIFMMVKNHMHTWSPFRASNVWERIVAYGDYIASREAVGLKDVTYLVKEGTE